MNGNNTAFPFPDRNQTPNGTEQLGLTKRELFAAMALQGMLASDMSIDRTKANKPVWAKAAVEFSDALLAALSESGERRS